MDLEPNSTKTLAQELILHKTIYDNSSFPQPMSDTLTSSIFCKDKETDLVANG